MAINTLLSFTASITELFSSTVVENRSFNLIQSVVRGKLHETSHSRILGEILRYDQAILKSFIDEFVEPGLFGREEKWDVFIEKDNIDITILGAHNVIIIENKVNNAPEQYRQIDRYVGQKLSEGKSNIYVLYLSQIYPLMPSEYSFDDSKDKCTFINRTYKNDIRRWINEILLTQDKAFSIHSALYHYRNYLDNMIDSKSYSEIPEEISTEIEKYLAKSGCQENTISALEQLSSKLQEASEICKKLMYEKRWAEICLKIDTRLKENNLPPLRSMQKIGWDLPDAGIEFSIDGMGKRFYAVVSYLRQRYIGIIDPDNNGSLDETTVRNLKCILSPMCSEPKLLSESQIYSTFRYPYWFKVDNDSNLIAQYLQMITILSLNDKVSIINSRK